MNTLHRTPARARWNRVGLWLIAVTLAAITFPSFADSKNGRGVAPKSAMWPTGGHGLGNTRNNEAAGLTAEKVAQIAEAWSTKLDGDPWTQPTVAWGKVFIGTNTGYLYALDAVTGDQIWAVELKDYWSNPGPDNATDDSNDINDPDNLFPNPAPEIAATRTAPAARNSKKHGPVIYIGDQAGNPTLGAVPFNGANIYMIDADNGELLGMTKVAQNDRPPPYPAASGADFTVLTGAIAVYKDTLVTGVAGLAEANPDCKPFTEGGCTLRGRVMAFDADTLQRKWQTYTTPETPVGYTGASVWQSTPAIDKKRGLVYVGTGDNYTTPYDTCYIAIEDKVAKGFDAVQQEFLDTCIDTPELQAEWAQNFVDSILALDLETGEIVWSKRTLDYDTWNLACLGPDWRETCGPDMDFSHHPMLCDSELGKNSVLVVGQKTGEMRGLNPDTGAELWKTDANAFDVLKEGLVGGFQWGAACTGHTVIGLHANSFAQDHLTTDGLPTSGGSIIGFDTTTGAVKFETLPDTFDRVHNSPVFGPAGLQGYAAVLQGYPAPEADDEASAIGAASCAGDVCGWGTSGGDGLLLLTDVKTGQTLWTKDPANGSVLWGGAFVRIPQHGTFWFVGSGYPSFDTGAPSDGTSDNFWAYRFPSNNGKGKKNK